jgi:hypothetical protein
MNESGLRGGSNVPLGELDAAGKVPANIVDAIDDLLASIAPEGSAAYAVRRFDAPAETSSFLCLIACHPSVDTLKRPASSNHARILCLDPAEAWLDIQALIGLAEDFQRVVGRDAQLIREHLHTENSVTAPEWNITPVKYVDRSLVQTVIENCLASVNRPETLTVPLPPQPSPLEVLRDVAAAWCSLPLAIQRTSSFSVGALPGTRVKLLFTAAGQRQAPVINPQIRQLASSYIEWLLDRPDDARALIVNSAIRDAQMLQNAYQQMNEPRAAAREEPEMSKKKSAAEVPRGDVNQTSIRYINEQVAKAEESLRDYVQQWMKSGEPPPPRTMPGAPLPAGAPAAAPPRGMREIAIAAIPGAIAGAAMALLIVFLMRPHSAVTTTNPVMTSSQPPPATATQTALPAVQPAMPTPADKLPGADWAHRLESLNDDEPRRLGALATNIAATETLSGQTQKSFTAMREQLDGARSLKPQELKLLRVILFQMLAHQISQLQITIDGKYGKGTAAAIPVIRDALKLESKTASSDGEIANLQAEAILRWAAREHL